MLAEGLLAWWWHRRETGLERRSAAVRHQAGRNQAGQVGAPPVVESVPMAAAGDHASWFASGRLMRAPYCDGSADVGRAELADPLLVDDLTRGLVLEIIDALKQAQTELAAGRSTRRQHERQAGGRA